MHALVDKCEIVLLEPTNERGILFRLILHYLVLIRQFGRSTKNRMKSIFIYMLLAAKTTPSI